MSRRAPRPVAAALEGLTRTLEPATTLARAQAAWNEVAGPAIAAAATPVNERDGVLTVRCEAAVWAQELDLMAGELIARMNAALGSQLISSLRCRTG